MADSKQKYYRVNPDGKAPKGLKAGDQVVTGGGTWRIDAVRDDGSYASTLVDKNLTTKTYQGEYAVPGAKENPADGMQSLLDEWTASAAAQKAAQIDYSTDEDVAALTRSLADADEKYRAQRANLAVEAARAMDNAAHYAEARGDRGGIGQGQYNEIQAAALKSRQALGAEQTKLAADTAREIAALRAKGEFKKADALLELTQKRLGELMTLARWSAEQETKAAQSERSREQWEKNYELTLAGLTGTLPDGTSTAAAKKERQAQLASAGEALLKAGVMPSAEQLAAMHMTEQQARNYINSLIYHGKL